MPVHIVQQGECLSSLAARFGLAGWKQLYEHAANEKLRKKRPNPNVLAPGDEVVVPDPGPENLVPIATGRMHTFSLKLQKVRLRIALVDRSGKPYEVKRFIVNTGASEIEKKTAPGGVVEVDVPALESTARLRVWIDGDDEDTPTFDRDLAIGHIDPIDTNTGVQGRLANLGYNCAITEDGDSQVDDQMLAAVRAFRAANGLPEVEPPQENSSEDDASSETEPSEDRDATAAYAAKLLDDAFRSKLLAVYESGAAS